MSLVRTWPPTEVPALVHGTAVSFDGRGALIIGSSGAGKSSLALQLMAFGAGLISDDLVWIERADDALSLARPEGVVQEMAIEARGLGLLRAEPAGRARLHVVVDMSRLSLARLPDDHQTHVAGHDIPVIHKVDVQAFPAMVLQYLKQQSL